MNNGELTAPEGINRYNTENSENYKAASSSNKHKQEAYSSYDYWALVPREKIIIIINSLF